MIQVFISYSHKDREYAHKLADELTRREIEPWIDDRIDYGTNWPRVIQENLDKCPGFIVIMSSNAYNSDWVQNEVSYAQGSRKAIFPILLEGKAWVSFAAKQYADARNGELPPDSYFETIKEQLGRQTVKLPYPKVMGIEMLPGPPEAGHLVDRIVDHIMKAVSSASSAEWDVGLFRISYTYPPKTDPKKKVSLPAQYSLDSEILNTNLFRRYNARAYQENEGDFEKFSHKGHARVKRQPEHVFGYLSKEEGLYRLGKSAFKERMNLELSLFSRKYLTENDVKEFAVKLVAIHKAHHIPVSEIDVKVVERPTNHERKR